MAIDYEAEYNNRARVPGHPEVVAGWARDAAAYRADMTARKRVEPGLKYGPSPRQALDLFHPEADGGTAALFIHGGYWRTFDPSSFSHMAKGLTANGVTVAVVGYDLCPQVTVNDIIGQMRRACLFVWRKLRRPVTVYGHSAGGHLAACMLATDWRAGDASAPADLVPAASAISGLFDLAPMIATNMNKELRLTPETAQTVSPLFWPAPHGRKLDAIVGGAESAEFLRQSRAIADTWGRAGVEARYEAVPGANHFDVILPLADPDSAMTRRLAALVKRIR